MNFEFLQNRKKLILIISIFLSATIIVFVLVFISGNKKKSDTSVIDLNAPVSVDRAYSNAIFGYTLEYPSWWESEETDNSSMLTINDKSNNVVMFFEAKNFPVDENTQALQSGIAEATLKIDPAYFVKSFKRIIYKDLPSYYADGVYDDSVDSWNFQEFGLYSDRNVHYTIRIFVARAYASQYDLIIKDILASLSIDRAEKDEDQALTPDQTSAIDKVRALTEVIQYEAELNKSGKKASFEAQNQGDRWLVQVFEIVKNDDGSSHTATFDWYHVDKKTGTVSKGI